MTGQSLTRFKAIYILAVCIFGLEIFNMYCNSTVFTDDTSKGILAFFGILGIAASILIAVAVQKATEQTAVFAKIVKLVVILCLVISSIYHAGFARDMSLANTNNAENAQKTSDFVDKVTTVIDRVDKLQQNQTELLKQDNRRIVNANRYFTQTGTKPKGDIKLTSVEGGTVKLDEVVSAIKPTIVVVDKEKIREEYVPKLWLWQSLAFFIQIAGSALLGSLKWQRDENQNNIPDEEEGTDAEEG